MSSYYSDSHASLVEEELHAHQDRKRDMDQLAEAMAFGVSSQRTSSLNREFKLPQASQEGSNFMAWIPAELKTQIFRYLLRNQEPLVKPIEFPNMFESRRKSSTPSPIPGNFEFAPQALRVCQAWHKDFADILYNDNAIQIDLVPDVYNGSPVLLIMGKAYEPDPKHRYAMQDHDGEDLPQSIKNYGRFHVRVKGRPIWLYRMRPTSPGDVYKLMPHFCRALVLVLFRKKVTFELCNEPHWATPSIEADIRAHFSAFKLFRCQSLNFVHGFGSLALRAYLLNLQREVCSQDPPIDVPMVCSAAVKFLREFRTRFLSSNRSADGFQFRKDMEVMERKAREWDWEGFQGARGKLMRYAKGKMREMEALMEVAEEAVPDFLDA